jgi:hypothetical protein
MWYGVTNICEVTKIFNVPGPPCTVWKWLCGMPPVTCSFTGGLDLDGWDLTLRGTWLVVNKRGVGDSWTFFFYIFDFHLFSFSICHLSFVCKYRLRGAWFGPCRLVYGGLETFVFTFLSANIVHGGLETFVFTFFRCFPFFFFFVSVVYGNG